MQKYCRRCGVALTQGARFCRQCGAATDLLESSATVPLESRSTDAVGPPIPVPAPTELMTEVVTGSTRPIAPQAVKTSRGIRRRRRIVYGLIALVVVASAGALLAYRYWRSQLPRDQAVSEQPTDTMATAEKLDLARRARPEGAPGKSGTGPGGTSPDASMSPSTPSPDEPSSESSVISGEAVRAAAEHMHRGRQHFNAGHIPEALQEYEQAIRLDPTNVDVHYLIGLAYEQSGQLEAALEAFRKCTSGPYAGVAKNHTKMLEKKLRRSKSPAGT